MEQSHIETGFASGRHFSGTNTRMVLEYLGTHMPVGTVAEVLRRAGEKRGAAQLMDDTAWSSYDEFRRLLEAVGSVVGGPPGLALVGSSPPLDAGSTPDTTEMFQLLGSPAALYQSVGLAATGLVTVIEIESEEIGPTEWILRQRFKEGFEPYKEYCWFSVGLDGIIPRLFGFPAAEVIEEECQCDGAAACAFRVRWVQTDDEARRAEYFELRSQLLESRLEALQRTVADLVSADGLEDVLARVIASAARAVKAPFFVLAIEALPSAAQRVYAMGLDEAEADTVAAQLLGGDPQANAGRLVVDVASTRRHYGRLAAIGAEGARFFPQELGLLEAYGRLAAAALDSATALEDSRRQTTTARVLLELSKSLAEIASTEEMAAKLARAVPAVIDCDRAVVVLCDPETSAARVAAVHGYAPDVEAKLMLADIQLPSDGEAPAKPAVYTDTDTEDELITSMMADTGSLAGTTVPLMVNGVLIGWVTAAVTERPERLLAADVAERLMGLAGQAATAIGNARLIDKIQHQALHDGLTGLPNRLLILDRVDQMLNRARRQSTATAAMFIDLDGFKDINDTLGHSAGDQLLQAVTARLAAALRESDTIGRLGGDEFIVLFEGPSLDDGPEVVAQRLLDSLKAPFQLEGRAVPALVVTASIGIAVGDRAGAGELLRDADIALYAAKAAGKNCFVTYEPHMQAAVQDRLELHAHLRGALDADQFSLVYQPIFDLRTKAVTGVEALLRWRHPTLGFLPPDEIVPLLEDTGLTIDVGRWVLHQACQQAASWHAQGNHIAVSVAVSARHLDAESLVEDVAMALSSNRLDPALCIIEVTETTIMRDAKEAARRLHALKAIGVRVAIGDFGTGFGSLAYLSQFPVDALKIDRSFINTIARSPEAGAFIHILVQLGKTLGLETLSDGIQGHYRFTAASREHFDSSEGFLLARPLDAGALEAFLASSSWPSDVGSSDDARARPGAPQPDLSALRPAGARADG